MIRVYSLLRRGNFLKWTDFDICGINDRKMKTERGLSINNPNESWLESKGTWFTYVLLITIGHLVILSVPFFDTPTAWTLTNTFHNLVSWTFWFFSLSEASRAEIYYLMLYVNMTAKGNIIKPSGFFLKKCNTDLMWRKMIRRISCHENTATRKHTSLMCTSNFN